jgi:protein-S-isoprenylcysteine O-methyltransferase Ste14
MFSHQASHLLHHARERTRIRPKEAAGKKSQNHSEKHAEQPRYLVKIGPFTQRRHPMYAGHILINLGFGIALHSVYALAWSTLAALIQSAGALHEEHQLRTWFPEKYPEYCRMVKRRFLSLPLWFIIGITYAAAWLGVFF